MPSITPFSIKPPQDRSLLPVIPSKERARKRRLCDVKSDSDEVPSQDESNDSERSDEEDNGNSVDSDESAVQELSEYEKLRLCSIERNNQVQEFYSQSINSN